MYKISIAVVVLNLFTLILNCGMNTHSEVAFKAYKMLQNQELKEIINNNVSFFQAGSPFPDWGFLCSSYGLAAEVTHWPPFTRLYVKHVKENYKKGDKRYEELIAFLLGIQSHNIADIIWHWGKSVKGTDETAQGFLHAMGHGASNCGDDWGKCHGFGDNGGDMFLSYRGNLRRASSFWSIPVNDMYAMYSSLGLNIPAGTLENCTTVFYLVTHVEWVVAWYMLRENEMYAPFLTEELDLFYHGGIDDMAINTIWKWENLLEILEGKEVEYSGAEYDYKEKSADLQKKKKDIFEKIISKIFPDEEAVNSFKELVGLTTEAKDGNFHIGIDKGFTLPKNISLISEIIRYKMFPNLVGLPSFFYLPNKVNNNFLGTNSKLLISSNVEYSYFGKSIVFGDFDGDGLRDVVIGAPGYGNQQQGAFYVVVNYQENMGNIDFNKPTYIGEEVYSRLGFSLTVLDVNHDGIDDLVVSAPTMGGSNGSKNIEDYYPKGYFGKVFIFYGSKDGLIKSPAITISTKLTKAEEFYNLGYFLGTGDCDGDGHLDLLIGSPYSQQGGDKRGSAAVFLNLTKDVDIEEADLFIAGSKDYQELGYNMACNKDAVFISSTGARVEKDQAVGSVTGYKLKDKSIIFKVTSDKTMSRLGASIDINNNLLAIGAPSYNNENKSDNFHNGAVFIYDINKLFNSENKDISVKDNIQELSILTHKSRARFGKYIKFSNDNLYVGSPQYTGWVNIEEGRVLSFTNISTKKGIISDEDSQVGYYNFDNGSRFGDNFAIDEEYLMVSAPFSSQGEFNGMVVVYS
jgi:glycosylphosphatidylinositol phospholipase D